VAAHNTAAFSVLGQEQESALLISLMSTLSALPFALFTLPAGAFADMVDRKKILSGTNLWQASVAISLALLALTGRLNSCLILASVFLFGIGFAFASPASASVEVEMGFQGVSCFRQHARGLADEYLGNHRAPHRRISRFDLRTGATAGVVPTFLMAGVLAILAITVVHLTVQKRLSIDFATDLNLEPAAITIFSHDLDPMRLSQAKDNPVSVVTEFAIDPANRGECTELMREIRLVYLRNGARDWHLYEDFVRANRFQMEVVASSWGEYQRQNERLTKAEKELVERLASLRVDTNPPEEFIRVSINKEVIKKNSKS
jgi:hypothetical protein